MRFWWYGAVVVVLVSGASADGTGRVLTPVKGDANETLTPLGTLLRDRYLRAPVAVLLDTEDRSLGQARRIWDEALANEWHLRLGVVVMPFDNTERNRVLKPHGLPGLKEALSKTAPSREVQGGVAFYTVLKATEQVPFDSAVLLFTGRRARDEDLAQLATRTLLDKRCKLYVWWTASTAMDAQARDAASIYQQVAEHTGGGFYQDYEPDEEQPEVEPVPRNDTHWIHPGHQDKETGLPKAILGVRRGVTGHQVVPLYVDSTVGMLDITLTGHIATATLQLPSASGAYNIDLLSETALRNWEAGAATLKRASTLHEVQLNTSTVQPGLWKLSIVGRTSAVEPRYDVIVEGNTNLGIAAVNFDEYRPDIQQTGNGSTGGAPLRLDLKGDIANITGVSVLDAWGRRVSTAHYRQGDTVRRPDGSVATELAVPGEALPAEPFYLQLSGHDDRGDHFTRMTYVLPPTAQLVAGRSLLVRLSPRSVLTVMPGQIVRLYFDITNNHSWPLPVEIACHSNHGRFIDVQPYRLYLLPQQTVTHVVSLQEPADTPKGTIQTIRFSAKNKFETVPVPVLLYIDDKVYDDQKPTLQYTFLSNCNGIEEKDCYSKNWNVQATLQDQTSGIFQISSQPQGISFQSEFTVGSKAPVMVLYSATCCQPKVDIIVTDLQNNTARYNIDVHYSNESGLSDGEIAAIVLGIIILIIIIVVIVLVIVCKKKQSHSFQQELHQIQR